MFRKLESEHELRAVQGDRLHAIREHAESTNRVFFIDKLLVRIQYIIVTMRRTDLASCEFKIPSPGSLTCNFLEFIEIPNDGLVNGIRSLLR